MMKRSIQTSGLRTSKQGAKKPRTTASSQVPDYHLTKQSRDDKGQIIWPAPEEKMEAARAFIIECAFAAKPTLIVPDKDADGLASGAILQRTLKLIGLDESFISVHVLDKGCSVHDDTSRAAMARFEPAFIFVLDQGSRRSPPLIDQPHRGIIIDHHHAEEDDHPENSLLVTACHCPPSQQPRCSRTSFAVTCMTTSRRNATGSAPWGLTATWGTLSNGSRRSQICLRPLRSTRRRPSTMLSHSSMHRGARAPITSR
ncbi:hypothetical protein V2G26_015569 [Clonostachys chloroleuca]